METNSQLVSLALLVLLMPLTGVAVNGLLGRYIRSGVQYVACGVVAVSWLTSLIILANVIGGDTVNATLYQWISAGAFRAQVGIYVDQLSALMMVVVTTVGLCVHVYSIGYMHGERGYARYFTYLNLFVFSMLLLVLSNNYIQMYVGWEAVGLCSYLLIGFWYEKKSAADAGKKAFVVNRIGDFGFALGLFLLFTSLGSLDFAAVFGQASTLSPGMLTAIALLLFVGAMGKSAQFPLYVWLPDAMEGPTPVSSLIHAATMVTAGVYMVARSHVIYSLAPGAGEVVAAVGAFTAIFAASIALVTNDIKRVLAYSTVSQLGYMFVAVGVGAYTAGIFHLMTHAFFKGLLFLTAGSVMHALAGELDMRRMGGLRNKIPVTFWTFLVGAVAIAGVPPLSGFWSKDEILVEAYRSGHVFIWFLGVVTALMTAFYTFRLIFRAFFGESRVDPEVEHHIHESPKTMTGPLVFLAAMSIIAGLVGIGGHGSLLSAFLGQAFGEGHASGPPSEAPEVLLVLVSVLASAGGIYLAYRLYMTGSPRPAAIAQRVRPVYDLLYNKYYVDEIYDTVIVRPIKRLSVALWDFVDTLLIDGLCVNGPAYLAWALGWVLSRLQRGYVHVYAASMVVGVVVLLYYMMR